MKMFQRTIAGWHKLWKIEPSFFYVSVKKNNEFLLMGTVTDSLSRIRHSDILTGQRICHYDPSFFLPAGARNNTKEFFVRT